ncbi:MAG: HAMP domain-containing sensor histidine kinase [Planctomycetota bacterium]
MAVEQIQIRSLRRRLLGPTVAAAVVAAAVLAAASYWLGDRWARDEMQTRFDAIERSLKDSNFPLNPTVLDLLAQLTQTELVGLDASGQVTHSTLELTDQTRRRHVIMSFATQSRPGRPDGVGRVEVLFDQQQVQAARRRAAMLPLATGISTILALSTITIALASRLAGRIETLRLNVQRVASGDFESSVSDRTDDELGLLGMAVDSMASQLSQLSRRIQRQQSEKLLHQVSGGLAHQIRNSLTGARMAIELHAKQCHLDDQEEIQIAISQIEASEDHVGRLMLAASGRSAEDRAAEVRDCFRDVRVSLSPLATHLGVHVQWELDEQIQRQAVRDGSTWMAAANNLVHNAMQAGHDVKVNLTIAGDDMISLRVSDNGRGIDPSIAAELFEPFVTTKPEGMGLGLSVVMRAAKRLGGRVGWQRENERTVFALEAAVVSPVNAS